MAHLESVQVTTLRFKPALQPTPGQPPLSFHDVCAELQAVTGVTSLHFGQQSRSRDSWTLVVRWASPDALDAFLASSAATGWHASLRAVADAFLIYRASLRGSVDAALGAPCTEVLVADGATMSFLEERMAPFVTAVDEAALDGHHGSAFGSFSVLSADGMDEPDGAIVGMFFGWDSQQAHEAQRGDGKVIDNNIHYIRGERKSISMDHVKLNKLAKIPP